MEINIKHRFRKEDSQIFNVFSFLLESSAVNNAQEIEFENAISAIYLFYGEEKTVTIVHGNMEMGYQEELNQVAGLLEADILSKNVPCYKKCCLGLTKKSICLLWAKELSRQTICFLNFQNYAFLSQVSCGVRRTE